MILNPWKNNWEPPELKKDSEFRCCPYNYLYPLPCKHGRSPRGKKYREPCRSCFYKQNYLNTAMSRHEGVVRVCDRCGAEIIDPDRIIYAIARDRRGEYLTDMELCRSCSQEFVDWIEGSDFPTNQMFDSFIESDDESEFSDGEE